MILFAVANFAICKAIVFLKLTVALFLVFFVLFVGFLIFSSSCLICSDCLIEILVKVLNFLRTWSSISLFVGLTLIDFLVKNKSPNKKRLSATDFFKFSRALGESKITFGANTYAFCGFVEMTRSKFCAFFDDLWVTKFCLLLHSNSNCLLV